MLPASRDTAVAVTVGTEMVAMASATEVMCIAVAVEDAPSNLEQGVGAACEMVVGKDAEVAGACEVEG